MKLVLFLALALGAIAQTPAKKSSKPMLGGVKTPGIVLDAVALKPEATIQVKGISGSVLAVRNSILVPQKNENSLLRIDPKTNQPTKPLDVKSPCGDAVSAFGGIWVGSCAEKGIVQLEGPTGKVKSVSPMEAALGDYRLASSTDSIWAISDAKTTLSRLDPQTGEIVAELRLPAGCSGVIAGESAVWAACPEAGKVIRIEPKTNVLDKYIDVKGASALATGAGSVWAWSRAEGKIVRIDPKTNKVSATIDLGLPGVDASMDFGGGLLWLSAPGFPINRISPESTPEGGKLLQQFRGDGSGLLRFALDAVWISDLKSGALNRYDPKRIAAVIAD